MSDPDVRKGQASFPLSRETFEDRYRELFADPAFDSRQQEIQALIDVAWDGYVGERKSPRTRKAGPEFKDPDYDLSVDWLRTRDAIAAAQTDHDNPKARTRILVICASSRNDKTCPGEMSKTHRMVQLARTELEAQNIEVDLLDLSVITSEYGKTIHPCKACVSTAMPLCHWPCSCYPNHSLGQVHDWMSEIYPRWVAAHGILIVTPVYWYQAPSELKLMMDRLVCGDGGNPDPSSTHGKKAAEAKAIEERGWNFPKHLEGRTFGLIVHGDSAGTEVLRRNLTDWFNDMHFVQAGAGSCIDRYIDYYGKYSTSHAAYDKDEALQEEVRNVSLALARGTAEQRQGRHTPDQDLEDPRPK